MAYSFEADTHTLSALLCIPQTNTLLEVQRSMAFCTLLALNFAQLETQLTPILQLMGLGSPV